MSLGVDLNEASDISFRKAVTTMKLVGKGKIKVDKPFVNADGRKVAGVFFFDR